MLKYLSKTAGAAVIAVGGAYGTLSEIGHALADGIPVIGLKTWAIARNGQQDQSMVLAHDPIDAVDKSLKAAERRGSSPNSWPAFSGSQRTTS